MLNKRPKFFTEKQSELLQLLFPAPTGAGLTMREACFALEITKNSGYRRLRNFHRLFPAAWEVYQASKRIMWSQRDQLRGGAEYGYSVEEPHNFGWDKRIKERF